MIFRKVRHKYHAERTNVYGINFPSKLEANCYKELLLLQKANLFKFFTRQISFDLPGKKTHKVDFCVFYENGVRFIESKGRDLPMGKLKREQVEDLYDIEIFVVKSTKELTKLVQTQGSECQIILEQN